jgi:hypothetical protein
VRDFLATTKVGRRAPALAEGDALSEVSGWVLREREERDEGRKRMDERGAEVGERLEFFPTFLSHPPPADARGRGEWGWRGRSPFVIAYVVS